MAVQREDTEAQPLGLMEEETHTQADLGIAGGGCSMKGGTGKCNQGFQIRRASWRR